MHFRLRAAFRPSIRPSSLLIVATIASSIALPPMRSDWARTICPPATTAASVVPPPTSTMKTPAPAARSKPAPAAAATGSSTICTVHRGRTAPAAAASERRSTQVAPPGTQTTAPVRSRPRRSRARCRKPCSIAVAASRSAMTPSRSGCTTSTPCGSLPASASAASPTAATRPVDRSSAIADGSSMTSPRPEMLTSVFTVPRSIATPDRNRITAPLAPKPSGSPSIVTPRAARAARRLPIRCGYLRAKPQLRILAASLKAADMLVGELCRTTPISVTLPRRASKSRQYPAADVFPVLIPITPG